MKYYLARQRNKFIIIFILLLAAVITFTTADLSTDVAFNDTITPTATIDSTSLPVKLTTYSSSSATYSFVDLDSSLIGWWRGEANNNDDSGLSNTIISNGGETTYSSETEYDGDCVFGDCFYLNGVLSSSGDYLTVSNIPIGQALTLSFLVNPKYLTANPVEDFCLFDTSTHDKFSAYISDINKLNVLVNGSALGNSGTVFYLNNDTHILITIDGSSIKAYANGNLVKSGTIAHTTATYNIYFGHSAAGPNWNIKALFDEILIFNRVLGAEEVLSLYNSKVTEYEKTFTVATTTSHTITGYAVDTDGIKVDTGERTITYLSAVVPTLSLSSASNIARITATLNASVTDDGGASTTNRGFYYGLTTAYGSIASTTASGGVGAFSQAITGLTCGTTYHYSAFAINAAGTATTSDSTFNTLGCARRSSTNFNTPVPAPDLAIDPSVNSISTTTIDVATSTEPVATSTQEIATTTLVVVDEIVPEIETQLEPEPKPELDTNLRQEDFLLEDDSQDVDIFYNNEPVSNEGTPSGENAGGNDSMSDSQEGFLPPISDQSIIDSLVDVTKESIKKVLAISFETSERIEEIVNTPTGSLVTKTVATAGVVTGSVLAVSSVAFANPITFTELWLLPARLFGLLAGALGVRRKNRPWGTVYDSVTKRPLDPAYVTLYDIASGKQVASAITDLDGRYGFLVPPGVYKIVAQKTNYIFPSKTTGLAYDEVYNEIYYGGEVLVGVGDIITKNIPMDPQNFDWNEFTKNKNNLNTLIKGKDITWAKISKNIFLIGLFIALLALYFAPAPYNYIIVGLYILTIISNHFTSKKDRVGVIKDSATGELLSYSIIKIYREGETEPMLKKVANEHGEYYCLVPSGRYSIKIDKKLADGSYSQIYSSEILNIDKGIINFDINL